MRTDGASRSRVESRLPPPPPRRWRKRLGLEEKRARHAVREALLEARLALGRGIRHVHGPTEVRAEAEQAVVLCLVRNGAPWLPSYLDHHLALGARHVVLLDNGSEDDTLAVATSRPRVSVFSTRLPFAPYHVALKRWLVRRFGRGGWRLYCDVDELFDYPCSGSLGLSDFLAYLNRHGYTAAAAQVLDMFSEEPLAFDGRSDADGRPPESEDLEAVYRLYDVSHVRKTRNKYWLWMNRLDADGLRLHTGGIRGRAFGLERTMLTKHPLLKPDGGLRVFPYDDHFVTGARLADVSCLIRHYTFTRALAEQIRDYTDPRRSFNIPDSYARYRHVWSERGELSLAGPGAREYRSPEALLDEGFLFASERYVRHARSRAPAAASPAAP